MGGPQFIAMVFFHFDNFAKNARSCWRYLMVTSSHAYYRTQLYQNSEARSAGNWLEMDVEADIDRLTSSFSRPEQEEVTF